MGNRWHSTAAVGDFSGVSNWAYITSSCFELRSVCEPLASLASTSRLPAVACAYISRPGTSMYSPVPSSPGFRYFSISLPWHWPSASPVGSRTRTRRGFAPLAVRLQLHILSMQRAMWWPRSPDITITVSSLQRYHPGTLGRNRRWAGHSLAPTVLQLFGAAVGTSTPPPPREKDVNTCVVPSLWQLIVRVLSLFWALLRDFVSVLALWKSMSSAVFRHR